MRIETNEKEMKINVFYKSKGEFKKLAGQKKLRKAIKALDRAGLANTEIDKEKYQVRIECYVKSIYDYILKGFKSVEHMTK